jgi:hypothetical protein
MLRTLCLLALIASQNGCESCEFTFGTLDVHGHLTIKGPVPAGGVTIEVCDGPDKGECTGDGYADTSSVPMTYAASLVPTGAFTCGFSERWIVFEGKDCTRTAIQPITHEDFDKASAQAAALDDVDVTLYCGQSAAAE